LPARVEAASLLGDVRALAAPAMEGRAVGTPGGKKARDYLLARYAALGLQPVGASFEQPFTFTPGRGLRFWRARFWQAPQPVSGVNLVGRIPGSVAPDKYLVVSAHYDHLGIRAGRLYPGADDNASGVAALLAVAGYFRQHPPRHSLLLIAFDGEERGLRGARAYVQRPSVPRADTLLDVNFDMLSRSPAGEIFLSGLHANPQLRPLLDPVRASAVPTLLYGHDLPRPFWSGDDWTDSSDHGAFHDQGIPFLYFGVEDHPDYHQPGDTFQRVDRPFFTAVANTMVDAMVALDAAPDEQLAKRP
jgi:Zn-dependent M28 family amino/carboxypeptidase